MSKLAKIALVIAVAFIAIGAKYLTGPSQTQSSGTLTPDHVSISPEELTRAAGPLPELRIENPI